MKRVLICIIMCVSLGACGSLTTKSKESGEFEFYVVLLKNTGSNYKIGGTSFGKLFYNFSVSYETKIIINKENQLRYFGPQAEKFAQFEKYFSKESYSVYVEIKNVRKKEELIKAYPDFFCFNPPIDHKCFYEEGHTPGTKEYIWGKHGFIYFLIERGARPYASMYDSYLLIDPKIGRELEKIGKSEIDPKEYKNLYKYIKWDKGDSVYYVDGDYECLYKKGNEKRIKYDKTKIIGYDFASPVHPLITTDAPPCNFK